MGSVLACTILILSFAQLAHVPTGQLGLLVSKSEFGFFWAILVFTVSNRSIYMSFFASIDLESSFLE